MEHAETKTAGRLGTLHVGDCLTVMRGMPDESVGTVVTSPPYNLKNSTGGGMRDNQPKPSKWSPKLRGGYADHGDAMPHGEYVAWQRDCLSEMLRVLRPDGAIFYNHKWRVQGGLMQDRADIVDGFPVRQIVIWRRAGSHNFNPGYFLPNYEVIYLIAKPDFQLAEGANTMGAVWSIPQERSNPHPAPFPVALADRCLRATGAAPPVLDPFLGSGTTGLAAEALEMPWVGIEKSPEYADLTLRRIAEDMPLFG